MCKQWPSQTSDYSLCVNVQSQRQKILVTVYSMHYLQMNTPHNTMDTVSNLATKNSPLLLFSKKVWTVFFFKSPFHYIFVIFLVSYFQSFSRVCPLNISCSQRVKLNGNEIDWGDNALQIGYDYYYVVWGGWPF